MAGDEVGECLFDWSAHFAFLISSVSRKTEIFHAE